MERVDKYSFWHRFVARIRFGLSSETTETSHKISFFLFGNTLDCIAALSGSINELFFTAVQDVALLAFIHFESHRTLYKRTITSTGSP